jgi:hypothetical protein
MRLDFALFSAEPVQEQRYDIALQSPPKELVSSAFRSTPKRTSHNPNSQFLRLPQLMGAGAIARC